MDTKYPYVCHAEANAVLNATQSLKECTAYVTLYPCNECAKLLIQAGVKTVAYLERGDTKEDASRASERLFDVCRVNVWRHVPRHTVCITCTE